MRLFVCVAGRRIPRDARRAHAFQSDGRRRDRLAAARRRDERHLGARREFAAKPPRRASRFSVEPLPRPLATPSRVADNLYWIGRYLERITQLARLLDKLDPLLRDEVAALDPGVAADALHILLSAQGSYAPPGASPEELAGRIRTLADDPDQPGQPRRATSAISSAISTR